MCFQRSLQELFDIGQQVWIKISAWKSSTHTDISKASNASLKVVFEPFAWQHSGCSLSLIVVKSESAVNKKQESETKTTQLLCLFYWRQNICLHLLPVWLYAKPFSFHPCWYLHLLAQHRKEALNHKKKKKMCICLHFLPLPSSDPPGASWPWPLASSLSSPALCDPHCEKERNTYP